MIKKFRKKPVIIEAVQWTGNNEKELKDFVNESLLRTWNTITHVFTYRIKTLEGDSYVLQKNDWIIKGVKGEFYPIKNDIFLETYEEINGEIKVE